MCTSATGIELILDTKVVKVNLNLKTLLTQVHETITYRTLIIATGARVSSLPHNSLNGMEWNGIESN